MSNEGVLEGVNKTPGEQIESLKRELAGRIEKLKEEYDFKMQPFLRQIEQEAALELVRGNSLLMQDDVTQGVIKRGGKTVEGKPIKNLGNFLAERIETLEKDPGLSYGPKRKWDDLPPDAKGTPHTEE